MTRKAVKSFQDPCRRVCFHVSVNGGWGGKGVCLLYYNFLLLVSFALSPLLVNAFRHSLSVNGFVSHLPVNDSLSF